MAGNSAPTLSGKRRRVVSNESYLISDLVSVSDRDGDEMSRYRVTVSGNGQGGYLFMGTTRLAPGQTYVFNAADFAQLTFQALLRGREQIDTGFSIRAYDGEDWSDVANASLTTLTNANRPIIRSVRTFQLNAEMSVLATDLFEFYDQDKSTGKRFRFEDKTGGNGGFYLNGNLKTGKFQISLAHLDKLVYVAADQSAYDQLEISAYDGRFWSTTRKMGVESIGRPELEIYPAGDGTNLILNQQERISVDSLIEKIDPGPAYVEYEIFDASGGIRSGGFFDGIDALEDRTFHTLSAEEFNGLVFEGGKFEVRSHDEIFIRVANDSRWSRWTKLTVNTEPEMVEALAVDSWLPYRPTRDPLILTFSFANYVPLYYDGGATERTEFLSLTNELRAAAREALSMYERYINVRFVEVPESTPGDISFGMADLDDGVVAWAYYPSADAALPGYGGDVWYNWFDFPGTWLSPNVGPGSFAYEVTLHELGHALGLKHPFEPVPILPNATDHSAFTVMSYRGNIDNAGLYAESAMLYDVAALQSIYGANEDYASGDSFYSYGRDQASMETIWDTGGEDTISASNQNIGATIDLRQGQFSSISRHNVAGVLFRSVNNIVIAYDTIIENATGSSFGDVLIGNEQANELRGNDGNDRLTGNQGDDLLVGGNGSDTYVYEIGDGDDTINEGGLGVDTLELHWYGRMDFDQLTFRREGTDLLIDLTIEGPDSYEGTIRIRDSVGQNRVESLQLFRNGNESEQLVDLTSVYVNSKAHGQNFSISNVIGQFGYLAEPVVA